MVGAILHQHLFCLVSCSVDNDNILFDFGVHVDSHWDIFLRMVIAPMSNTYLIFFLNIYILDLKVIFSINIKGIQ